MNKSSTTNPLKRAATLLLLMLLSAANALAQTRWQGSGTEQDPYIINNTDDLEALANSVNSGTSYAGQFFRLNADLTYNTATQNNHTAIGHYDPIWDHPFSGTFDGDGHTISGIRINNNHDYQGLFGYCKNSTVKNLILTDARINGKYNVGGIVGYSFNGSSIVDCQVAYNVNVSGSQDIGGIVGHNYSSIEDCQVANNVTLSGSKRVGGIAGSNGGSIKNCQVANNVIVSGSGDDSSNIGGIAGFIFFNGVNDGSIENCQVANNVTVSGHGYVGGIAGYGFLGSSVESCHVVNNVTVSGGNNFIGGIAGYMDESSIADCQVANNVTINGISDYGTIVGYYNNSTFHRNYYLGCTVNGVANATDVGTFEGDITENNGAVPGYAIHTAADWDFFCDALQDNATYNHFIGMTVWLAADIEITRMAGSSYHDFMGTFDGDGHTLTLAYGSAGNFITEEYAAPFRNLENGAVIHSLHVDGHIYTSNKFASGIAGCQWGTVSISNCRSSVIIYSSKIGDGTHGGIVADQHGTLTVNGCVFDGLLLTTALTTLCGGLVGYHNEGTCTISDCLYAPSEANLPWGLTYITDGATFCRNYSGTPANCYYTETLGEAQGKQAHSITSEDVTPVFAGEATGYDVSGLSTNGVGLAYLSTLYASNEDQVSLNLTTPEGFSVVAATYTPEGGTATELTPVNGVYTFTMPDADVVIDAVTEYIIHDTTEWNNFCDALVDNDTYNHFIGKTVRLAADIEVTRMAGSDSHDFMGTFDGQGHTLTVAYGSAENPITEEYAAPFRNLENGAVIRNLHVDGHIYTSEKYASGLAGCLWGTVTISNCRSSVIIHSSKSGDGTHGGIVAVHHNTLTVNGCVFDGRLLTTNGTTLCGGLIGYHYGTITLSDCLYAPTTDITLAPGETYITNGATLCRNYSGMFDNCYYTETLGTAQGKLAHSITSEDVTLAFAGEATGYDVSGITVYGVGLAYLSTLYASNGDQVSLTFPVPEGFSVTATYTPEGGTATELTPVNGVYSFTMPNANVVINVVTEYLIHNATEWNNFCDALQDNTSYNRFIGKTVKLAADITVTRMAGSSTHDFMGTFDGDGHTLTLAYGSAGNPITEEYAAPFRNLENGAYIHSLNVDGHIYTSDKYASGIAGNQYGTVTISDCRSSVIIHSSKQGDGTHGGFVATQHGTLTMSGCVFDGRLLTTNGTTLCSGLVGYHNNGTCTISDCLYAPAEVALGPDETCINTGATFCRNYSGTPANCYYTETLGTAQGKQAHSITSEDVTLAFAGEVTEYNVSGITSYGTGIMYGSVLYAGNGDEVGLTFSAPEGFSVVSATYTPEDGMATELTFADGVYSFTMPDANVVIDAVTEYLIHNATEWNNFCDALQDNDNYNRFIGQTVKLAADITVTRMAGSSYHDFMGTFDGQGHTLTVAYGSAESPITEEYAAPFRNLENGANIHSLHVDGHIYTSDKYASGIAGNLYGTVTISNCRSSVIIHSSKSGDGTHGGIVATQHGTLTLSGCVFDGRLLTTNGTTLCSGLVGYHNNGTCTISDCLYAPATDVTLADGETYITDGATFCRNYSGTPENCYYTEALGTAQGKLALTNPAVLPVGEPTATYDVSSLTLYGNGIQFGEVFYYDTERNFLRTIAGYGTGDDGWNLIASPVANDITPTAANGFLTEAYDLFRFNQAADLEWENWKDNVYDNYHFDLASGRGYLYASQTETTLVFTGTPYSGTGEVTLTKTEGVNLSGWNLVGNPFATAKTIGSKPFYRMNNLGSEIIAAESDTIAAMEGIFVVANTDGETVTFAEPTRGDKSEGRIIINLCNNAAVIDRAIVRLGEGEMLPKLQIREGNTKVYLPQGGTDYAVACVGRDGVHTVSTTEVPVNFKAKEDGTYTISINPEVVEMDYLHLIDNMTGADVDLLVPEPVEGPASYTFTAKTTDYETRFRLVFSNCGDAIGDNEAFAFISNGNIIVNGEGVLQIVDVMGRVILCRDAARHVSTNRMTPGVYVLRLINGNDVRTQKIVIE